MNPSWKVDRTRFPRGPWDEEPEDFVGPWQSHGLTCHLTRNTMGSWCGYVTVPAGHILFGMPFDVLEDVGVHGGLSYAAREGDGWAFGFDCSHHGDITPSMRTDTHKTVVELWGDAIYRTREWTKDETHRLAEQLATYGARANAAAELLRRLDRLIDDLAIALGSILPEYVKRRAAERRREAEAARKGLAS